MHFQRITATNFRSLNPFLSLTVGRAPGLYFMTGHNEDRPKLGANGIGKSSIWQALYWCLYGATTDGLRADALRSNVTDEKRYGVRVKMEDSTAERWWGPNALQKDGKDCSDLALPLSAVEFEASVFACQNGQTLLDYTPTKRLELVSSVLNLERWRDLSQRASSFVRGRQQEVVDVGMDVARLTASINAWRTTQPEKQREEFEEKRKAECVRITVSMSELRTQYLQAKDQRSMTRDALMAIKNAATRARVRYGRLKFRAEKLEAKEEKYMPRLRRAEARLEELKRVSAKFNETGAECEVCGNIIDKKHRRAHWFTLRRRRVNEARKIDLYGTKLRKLAAAIEGLDLATAEQTMRATERAVLTGRFEWQKVRNECKNLRESLLLLRRQRAKVKSEPNPHDALSVELAAKIAKAEAEVEVLQKKEAVARAKLQREQFWVSEFKEIQYYVLEGALEELTAVAQAHVLELGMAKFRLAFTAEREKKDGNMTRTFDALIHTPHSKSPVPLASLSGGEQQRLRIASAFALSDFLQRRKGVSCNIEVYDEPTHHLSQEGIDALLDALKDRARQKGKAIWLVDHHSLNYSGFADVVQLVMRNGRTVYERAEK